MTHLQQTLSLSRALPPARFAPYLSASGMDQARAEDLYRWNARLSGAWHVHLGYIEIALRHALDQQLREWNAKQSDINGRPLTKDWTTENGTAPLLYNLIGTGLREARKAAEKDSKSRPQSHSRHQLPPTHDDIVAQLTFGTWSRLLRLPGQRNANKQQQMLWQQCLALAFPNASSDTAGLEYVGRQAEGLRRLRNRIAHHENLLAVDTHARLNGSLALLRQIDQQLPAIVMRDNMLRTLAREDPRL
ncbi:MAG: Abi family protein [Actinomycetaceae bacterium]|nr:Abi family protein [Actinomycetaceae bacterium]